MVRTPPPPGKPTHTDYIITLRAPATPDDPDGIQRLRRWLKRSWRAYSLRCISIGRAALDRDAEGKGGAT